LAGLDIPDNQQRSRIILNGGCFPPQTAIAGSNPFPESRPFLTHEAANPQVASGGSGESVNDLGDCVDWIGDWRLCQEG
jgi:hypothetical protein